MNTTQRCLVPPSTLAVALADAKKNLRVDGNELDDQITVWIQGITAALEHEIGQRLIRQTWEVVADAFPLKTRECIGWRRSDYLFDPIELPHPVLAVTSVAYTDAQGAAQTLAPDDYRLHRAQYRSALVPAVISGWPQTSAADSSIVVQVECGFGEAPADVPVNIRLYILAKLVEQFDPATRTERDTVQSAYLDRLLDACRAYT